MDENRVVNGLAPTHQLRAVVRQAGEMRNDLEDSGGAGYLPRRRQPASPEQAAEEALQQVGPEAESGGHELLDSLERLRTTDEEAGDDLLRLQRLRGRHHYRERDPITSRYYRRRDEAGGGAPADPAGSEPSA